MSMGVFRRPPSIPRRRRWIGTALALTNTDLLGGALAGSYAVSGAPTSITVVGLLVAGGYAITGAAATTDLLVVDAQAGVYSITGLAATLITFLPDRIVEGTISVRVVDAKTITVKVADGGTI